MPTSSSHAHTEGRLYLNPLGVIPSEALQRRAEGPAFRRRLRRSSFLLRWSRHRLGRSTRRSHTPATFAFTHIRRLQFRPHRQTALGNQLHRLIEMGMCTAPLGSVNGCGGFNNSCSESTILSFISPASYGLQPGRGNTDSNSPSACSGVPSVRALTGRGLPYRARLMGFTARLRKQHLAARHEAEHSPDHQLDKNARDKQSDQETQNAAAD